MKKGNILLIIGLGAVGLLSSCSDWLDVKPKQSVEEEELFSREIGFKEALTGVYINMASTGLYGRNLSYGFLDVLGQYYSSVSGTKEPYFQNPLYYQFPSELTESTTAAIWADMYNVIANINNLLYWEDKNKSVFTTPGYYEIIRGEALGLRGFLHFDLLRMFGPVYKENPAEKRISYRSVFDKNSKVLLPSNVVIDSIIGDLKAAEQILSDVEPGVFEFPESELEESSMQGDRFLVYRHKRMNLYAVKATLARVYMYAGNTTEAARYANEVVESGKFELVTNNVNDRLYSREILFSIYLDKFEDQVVRDFSSINGRYWIAGMNFLEEIFDVAADGGNDIRMREGTAFDVDVNGIVSRKYLQDRAWASLEGTIPLIRLPEMYYILAECSDDDEVSASWLNQVREARGIMAVAYDGADREKQIMKEYRKEFYGEGQLFFYYKRHYYREFLHCPLERLYEGNYVFNLPENEILFGQTK